MSETMPHLCPPAKKGTLTFEVLQAARAGNVKKVKAFLDDGGDVNGGDSSGVTLLLAACEQGRTEVTKTLLENPDLHINSRCMGITPLALASSNGHEGCVRVLLESKSKCQLNLRIRCLFKQWKRPPTALCAAALAKKWTIFEILIEYQDTIMPVEMNEILSCALNEDRWDIIERILQKASTFQGVIFLRIVQEAYVSQLWDIIHLVFEKATQHENYHVLHALSEMFLLKEWQKLESLLKILDENVRIDSSVAEALHRHSHKDVEKMLNENQIDAGALSGILLFVSLFGANDAVADILMSRMSEYSKDTLKYAFLIASMTDNLVELSFLATVEDFSYKTLHLAYAMANNYSCQDSIRLLKISLASKTSKIFPNFLNSCKVLGLLESLEANGEDGDDQEQ